MTKKIESTRGGEKENGVRIDFNRDSQIYAQELLRFAV